MKLPPTKPDTRAMPDTEKGESEPSSGSSALGRWAGRLGLLGLSMILSLLAGEGLIRILAPQQLILIRPDIWQPHEGLGWVQAPHLDTVVNTGERNVRLLTDGHGHRVGPGSEPEPSIRILALGDSYQAALQVDHAESFIALVEQQLTRDLGAQVEIVNAAVGGWGPSHYLLKARSELERQSYDQVVVFFYLGNDVEPRRIKSFAARESTVRHHFRWPRAATRDEIVKGWLYPINDFLETRSHFFLLLKNRLWFVLMRAGLSARRFPPVLLREEASAERWQVSAETCGLLADEVAERGLPVLFVLLPGIWQIDRQTAETTAHAVGLEPREIDMDQPSLRMMLELEKIGLQVIDITPAMRTAWAAGREALYGTVDYHFAAGGHRVVAEAVTPHLIDSLSQRRGQGGEP